MRTISSNTNEDANLDMKLTEKEEKEENEEKEEKGEKKEETKEEKEKKENRESKEKEESREKIPRRSTKLEGIIQDRMDAPHFPSTLISGEG